MRTVVSGTSARIHNTIAVARRSWNRSPGQPSRPSADGEYRDHLSTPKTPDQRLQEVDWKQRRRAELAKASDPAAPKDQAGLNSMRNEN